MVMDSTRLDSLVNMDRLEGMKNFLALGVTRPVSMAYFYLTYACFGLDAFWYRILNLGVLALSAVAVVGLLTVLLRLDTQSSKLTAGEKWAIPIGLGVLFFVHPVQTSIVLYIWQSQTLLACLFYCCSLLLYLSARSGQLPSGRIWYLACFLLFLASLMSKESAVTLPVILFLAEAAFFHRDGRQLLRIAAVMGIALGIGMVMAGVVHWAIFGRSTSDVILGTMERYRSLSGLTVPQILLSLSTVLFKYLSMLVVPLPSNVRMLDAMVVSRSLVDPIVTLLAILGAVTLSGLGVWLLRRRPLTGFGILFFIINVAPEPLLEPQFLFMAHRAALPMVGLLFVAADGIAALIIWAGPRMERRGLHVRLAMAFMIPFVWFAMVTHLRAEIWRKPLFFWRDIVKGLPAPGPNVERGSYMIALSGLGLEMERAGKYEEAIALYRRALGAWPGDRRALVNLGNALLLSGQTSQAIKTFKLATELHPRFAEAHFNLGLALLHEEKREEAVQHLRKAVQFKPRFAKAHYRLGKTLIDSGQVVQGRKHVERAIKLDPRLANRERSPAE